MAESFLDRRFHARNAGTSNLGEQVIPAEAVEAASEAFWDDEDKDPLVSMRKALEAAAPHMLAKVWDEGVLEADGRMETPYGIDYYTNPYRPTK